MATWLGFIAFSLVLYGFPSRLAATEERVCTAMENMSMCEPLGYHGITFPNPRGHGNVSQANDELTDFQELVDSGCSLYLRHFLCAYYAPLCKEDLPLDLVVSPCRELCTHVRDRCEPLLLANAGIEWPKHLQCDLFPTKTQEPWCFGPEDTAKLNEDGDAVVTSTNVVIPSLTTAQTAKITSASSEGAATLNTPATPSPTSSVTTPVHSCEPIPQDSVCAALDYGQATYPNVLGDFTREEAEHKMETSFNIAVNYKCSPYLIPLLCHFYHPQCMADSQTPGVPPCREFCTDVVRRCNSGTTKWPTDLDCTKLPSVNAADSMCKMADDFDVPMITEEPSLDGVDVGGGAVRSSETTAPLILISTVVTMVVLGVLKEQQR